MKYVVWPVLVYLQKSVWLVLVVDWSNLLDGFRIAFICCEKIYCVYDPFAYQLGTSKKTKLPKNLTISYIFCAGLPLCNIADEDIWTPGKKKLRIPVFFISWTYCWPKNLFI